MKKFKFATIPGDGIGKEVVPLAINVLETISQVHGGVSFDFSYYPWSCDYYLEHGKMMPDDGLRQLADHDAIFLGAVGDPTKVPDHISLWGLLLKIRKEFNQVLNIRPAKLLKGLKSPITNPNNFDFVIVRENSEGEYTDIGGRIHQGTDQIAIQNAVFTRKSTERAIRYAFELAKNRKQEITSATKSNGIFHSMPFWDEIFEEVKKDYPNIKGKTVHIDALAASFVTKPHTYDVVVASNLFGDILSDIGGAIMGSIGIAPSGNINMDGQFPSMFEPVHGSAPDIAGKGIANPFGQIWTAQMMLNHFGLQEISDKLLDTIETTLEEGFKTPDIGGAKTTIEVGNRIIELIKGW